MRSLVPIFVMALSVAAPATSSDVVPLPHFKSVELRGGGTVTITPGTNERVTIVEGNSGVSRLRVEPEGQLVVDVCKGECPRSYRLHVEIVSSRVPNLAVSGGGHVSVANGFPRQPHLSAAVNGGGTIDARAVEAASVSAAVNGGGELLVHPGANLAGAVNGGGHVRYWGNPHVTSALRGGGSIVRGY